MLPAPKAGVVGWGGRHDDTHCRLHRVAEHNHDHHPQRRHFTTILVIIIMLLLIIITIIIIS